MSLICFVDTADVAALKVYLETVVVGAQNSSMVCW